MQHVTGQGRARLTSRMRQKRERSSVHSPCLRRIAPQAERLFTKRDKTPYCSQRPKHSHHATNIPLRQPLTLGEAERTELPALHYSGGMFTGDKKTLRKTMKPVLLAEAKAKTKRPNMVVCYRNQPTR